MLLNIVFIIVGIVLVVWGANMLTDGSVAVAERMQIPQIVIGLTIVAMGTSMPEFCVSMVSALKGSSGLAIGNIVGSNTFNEMFTVGCAAVVTPITILKSTVKKDVPFAIIASVALLLMCMDGFISRLDAVILLVLFAVFMFFTLRGVKDNKENEENIGKKMSTWKAALFIVLGLAALIGGSDVFVNGATAVASSLGVSEAVIGLTIVACGTSLPELATSVVAARKGNSGIAIGNVLGSNVFNILAILGITGVICPMPMSGITMFDLAVMTMGMVLLWLFSFTKYKIERWEGVALIVVFVGYMVWLIK